MRLRELLDEKRNGKAVELCLEILGRRSCPRENIGFMRTRSDVTVSDGETCAYSDPMPRKYRNKRLRGIRLVERRDGRIHLSRPRILEEC